MSGKSASASGARTGGQRLVFYVAGERPVGSEAANLTHYQHVEPNMLYEPDSKDPSTPATLFYRSEDPDKLAFRVVDNIVPSKSCIYLNGHQYSELSCSKTNSQNTSKEVNQTYCVEYSDQENKITPQACDVPTYQTRCLGMVGGTHNTPVADHNQNQYCVSASENVNANSDIKNCSDRETSDKKCYQIVEQSVAHQSIINQSITIYNQQPAPHAVSVNAENSVPQLVHSEGGVVLAVLPGCSNSLTGEIPDNTSSVRSSEKTISVPFGWRRVVNGSSVLYISPSGAGVGSSLQLREYLLSEGTCKCGLPCPLRPDQAFSFDPKVVGKPWQSSGDDLTNLCNHKRKLMASLHHADSAPVSGTEVAVLKKKMKRNNGNVSLAQKAGHNANNDIKFGSNDRLLHSSHTLQRPVGVPNASTNVFDNQDIFRNDLSAQWKTESQVQKSSHYLTVNSGWIMPHPENYQTSKQHLVTGTANNSFNVGLPVLGSNGQIIGVNTGYSKPLANIRNNVLPQNIDTNLKHKSNLLKQNVQQDKIVPKEEESQVFCGLNQPLTPEVMRKINEQQQIFIQQNQKQIEIAMKSFKSQMTGDANAQTLSSTQYPQNQLVIQNGTVLKSGSAKTPPWQVKKSEATSDSIASPKTQRLNQMENVESSPTITSEKTNNYLDQGNTQSDLCSRVPPLPQHYNIVSHNWQNNDNVKKKVKSSNKVKKKVIENNKLQLNSDSANKNQLNIKSNLYEHIPNNDVPSFMENPSAYLAQQTALLNNTISRQVGVSSAYDVNFFDSHNYYNEHSTFGKTSKPNKLLNDNSSFRKPNAEEHIVASCNKSTPDSSMAVRKHVENQAQCCKDCKVSCGDNENQAENFGSKLYLTDYDDTFIDSEYRQRFQEDSTVSSIFVDKRSTLNENRSPIQAGIVSTSNNSPVESLQPPESSPTPSNSSRSTDTSCPYNGHGNSLQLQSGGTVSMQSPAYSNMESYKDNNYTSDHPNTSETPLFNHPHASVPSVGNQVMNFISNHNINKNLMEVNNISMLGIKPETKSPQGLMKCDIRKFDSHPMPGYCPPPHLGSGPAHSLSQVNYIQMYVTTMASGFSVTRDKVTSVLAGKANTSTTSINSSQANYVRLPPPPSVNLATTYAIPNNQPDPFLKSVNLPTSYPLHIAGSAAQGLISKSPLEMVQNVITNKAVKTEVNRPNTNFSFMGRKIYHSSSPEQILMTSTGNIIVTNNQMPPPLPKATSSMPSNAQPNHVTNITTSINQVFPAMGGTVQPLVNQQAVVVNTLQAPFVLQPPMMTVDGQVLQQNSAVPQLISNNILHNQTNDAINSPDKNLLGFVNNVVSPENIKKKSKRKKAASSSISGSNLIVHQTSPQQNLSPQFSPRGIQLSPNNNVSPTSVLQALTIVPGKSGTPAHIVMNGQGNTNNYGSQQIISNTSPTQPINLLQPVSLINNANTSFSSLQQFVLPNIGGMVMTADGPAIIQDGANNIPVHVQLQTVNPQNMLTSVQNGGVFATGANGGVVLRTQNPQGKLMQSQNSPQYLSANNQILMNGSNFGGQLSPLLASLSPTNVTFNTSPLKSSNVQTQEFIQTNQMGQTVMVPVTSKTLSMAPAGTASNRNNPTFVQHNTTIVQQQTTLLSNPQNATVPMPLNIQGGSSRVDIDPNVQLMKQTPPKPRMPKTMASQPLDDRDHCDRSPMSITEKVASNDEYSLFELANAPHRLEDGHVRHSVSTQTLVNQQQGKSPGRAASGASPPDTTTHSPLGALEGVAPVARTRCLSAQPIMADTTTKSPEPTDISSMAMVQCVSSSEQDAEWSAPRCDRPDHDMMHTPAMGQRPVANPAETTELHCSPLSKLSNVMPARSSYYDNLYQNNYKRKNEFGDTPRYRSEKLMRTNYNTMQVINESTYNDENTNIAEKSQLRHYQPSGSSVLPVSKQPDRPNVDSSNEGVQPGDVVWGPAAGHAWWPGQVETRVGGACRVRWFGGERRGRTLVDAARLITLTQGLEAHHAARTKHRKSRKLNTMLEQAIQEAMAALDQSSDVPAVGDCAPVPRIEDVTKNTKRGKKFKGGAVKSKGNGKKSMKKYVSGKNRRKGKSRLRSPR